MNPGKLNKKITIQKLQKSFDDEGIQTNQWIDIRTIFASLEDKIVRTQNDDNSVTTQVETNMIIRKNYKNLCTSNIRIVCENRLYDVLDLSDLDENYIKLITKSVRNNEC